MKSIHNAMTSFKNTERISEQGVEGNIWGLEGRGNRGVEKTT